MPISAGEAPLLDVSGVVSGYGKIVVLHGIDFAVWPGEMVALLGPNGAGKTTLLRTVSGLLPIGAGSVRFAGETLGRDPRQAARMGVSHVIEGHRVFPQLSILDNMLLAGFDLTRRERLVRADEALSWFPEIASRQSERAGALSGGQQQMLAVAQGLVRRPRLLLLDEPSAGLSPVLVDRVFSVAARLRDGGTAVVLVEQLIEKALGVADRVVALARGRVVLEAPAAESGLAERLEDAYFGEQAA